MGRIILRNWWRFCQELGLVFVVFGGVGGVVVVVVVVGGGFCIFLFWYFVIFNFFFFFFFFRKRIFISDWAFSPELYLTRESPLNEEHRLDNVSIFT